jgi:hypothetical protein
MSKIAAPDSGLLVAPDDDRPAVLERVEQAIRGEFATDEEMPVSCKA